MSDADLRELERRWRETGSVEDEAALLVERVRSGELARSSLEVARSLGHVAAGVALGSEAPALTNPLPRASVITDSRAEESRVVLSVKGAYGLGSLGNDDANAIQAALAAAFLEAGPRKVVVDMSAMSYEWGDSICQVFDLGEGADVEYVLSRDCEEAWAGILALVEPGWRTCGKVRFENPPVARGDLGLRLPPPQGWPTFRRWWGARSWPEKALWIGAILAATSAFLLRPFLRVVSPQLAVSVAGTACARNDPGAVDPWGRHWQFKPPETAKRSFSDGGDGVVRFGEFGSEKFTHHFPKEYAHLSLVEDADDPGVLKPPLAVRSNWINDDYTRYSVGPNGIDERLGGDDLVPEFLGFHWYQPFTWRTSSLLVLAVVLGWLGVVLGQLRRERSLGVWREVLRAGLIVVLPGLTLTAGVGAFAGDLPPLSSSAKGHQLLLVPLPTAIGGAVTVLAFLLALAFRLGRGQGERRDSGD